MCWEQKFSIPKSKIALQVQSSNFFKFCGTNLSAEIAGSRMQSWKFLAMVRNFPLRFFVPIGNTFICRLKSSNFWEKYSVMLWLSVLVLRYSPRKYIFMKITWIRNQNVTEYSHLTYHAHLSLQAPSNPMFYPCCWMTVRRAGWPADNMFRK